MKIKCMIDNVKYNNKPTGKEVGSIVNRLGKKDNIIELNTEELANKIIEGHTVKPAICGTRQEEWKEQQIFMVDIDEGLTIEQAIEKSRELNIIPAFIYTSFNHTKEHHKFRLVFISNRIIYSLEEGLKIQNILNKLFNADEHCKNLNRIYYAGKKIVYKSYNNRINTDKILNKYNGLWYNNNSKKIVQDNNNINNINISCTKKPFKTNYNIQAIKEGNIKYLQSVLNIKDKIILQNKQEFYDYIYKLNLSNLLGIDKPRSFNCIFHNDKNPSASIFPDPKTGNYIYSCNSNSCGVSYNIIQVIQALTKLKTYQINNFIKDLYNIKIEKTAWQKEQIVILETNKEMLLSGMFEKSYPNIYKLIKRYIPQLITMIDTAILNVRNENYTDNEGNIVFFISNSYLMEELKQKQPTRINQRNVLFAFLKLLKKLDVDEIPKKDLEKALKIKEKYKHRNIVSYFSIGDYDIFRMKESEYRAKLWEDNNMSMTGLSYEGIFRTFGKQIADELYPQYKKKYIKTKNGYKEVDRTTSKSSDERTLEIVRIIFNILEEKGYAMEKEIIEKLKNKFGKTRTKVQIKRSMQEILDGYNLTRIRANKEIKEKYRVDSKGYPFIIVENQ